MRITFLIHELAFNGAVVALFDQARRLQRRGHEVIVVTPPLKGPAGALEGRFLEAGIHVTRSVGLDACDVFIGCTVLAADFLFPLLGKKPVIWWLHEGRAGVRHVLSNAQAMQVFVRADVLVFPSRAVAETLYAPAMIGGAAERIEIVPGIVEQPVPGDAAPKPLGVLRVLCVGTVCPRKGQSLLIQAVAALQGLPIECVLAGEIVALDEPGRTLAGAQPEKYVLTGGLQPERVQELYRSADVFCLPSDDECMPLAPVEAAWHGVPVLLTDLVAYRGVWRHGQNALLHPAGDVELLAWSIRMLLESPSLRTRLAHAARAVAAGFSEARAGAAFDAALDRAVAGSRMPL